MSTSGDPSSTAPPPLASGREVAAGSGEPQLALRILVVDDCKESAGTLASLLELLGHETTIALDGEQALELAQRLQPDCAVLDLGLPGMSGLELAGRLRALPVGRGLVLIALSGWTGDEDRAASLQAGFDHHLGKPLDLGQLCDLLPSGGERPGREE